MVLINRLITYQHSFQGNGNCLIIKILLIYGWSRPWMWTKNVSLALKWPFRTEWRKWALAYLQSFLKSSFFPFVTSHRGYFVFGIRSCLIFSTFLCIWYLNNITLRFAKKDCIQLFSICSAFWKATTVFPSQN